MTANLLVTSALIAADPTVSATTDGRVIVALSPDSHLHLSPDTARALRDALTAALREGL